MSSKITVVSANRCDAIRELIPEYAFGLTDPEQTRFVEANIQHCSEAAAELADFQQLQAEMRSDVSQIEPPLSLESKLLAAIAEPTVLPTSKTAPAPVNQVRRRSLPIGWLVAAAAMIVLLLTNGYWLARVNDLNQQQAQLISQFPTTDYNHPAFILTSTSGLRWVRLPPAEEKADTSAFLMWNAESKIGLLYAHGFPHLAVGKTYQLWLTRGETRKGVGTFTVDENGQGALLFSSAEPIDEFTWARITDEPENGSPQPTGPIVVIGKLAT
jgi:anti-sigma-K factor RskA